MTQSTDAGADLQHAVLLACARAFGNLEGNGGVDEEILTHGLGKVKTVALQECLDGSFVVAFHSVVPFCALGVKNQ